MLTVVVGVTAHLFIHNWPATATFLTLAERRAAEQRLAADSDSGEKETFSWSNVLKALRDPQCWLYCFELRFMSLPLYTLSLFLPTIIKSLGYSAASAQLLAIPPYALATTLTVATAWISERHSRRAPCLLCSVAIAVIGYCILLGNKNPERRSGVSYGGVLLAAAETYPSTELVLSWPAVNVDGQTKRGVSNALQISIGNLGAVIGTQLYRTEDSPRVVVGHSVALAYIVMSVCVTLLTWRYLSRQNGKKDALGPGEGVTGRAGSLKGDDDPRWRFMR